MRGPLGFCVLRVQSTAGQARAVPASNARPLPAVSAPGSRLLPARPGRSAWSRGQSPLQRSSRRAGPSRPETRWPERPAPEVARRRRAGRGAARRRPGSASLRLPVGGLALSGSPREHGRSLRRRVPGDRAQRRPGHPEERGETPRSAGRCAAKRRGAPGSGVPDGASGFPGVAAGHWGWWPRAALAAAPRGSRVRSGGGPGHAQDTPPIVSGCRGRGSSEMLS